MEREQSIETLVVLGTSIIVFFVLLVVGFIIAHKRRLYVKESLIELLENECKIEIQKLKKELKELSKSNETIVTLEKRIEILENKLKEKSEET